jgi:DNA-directed RNA polymerase sigma subunit (sigma70/sigma32)
VVSKIAKLRRAAGLLSVELGREPDVAELADELGLPVASVMRWESAARSSMSLDEQIGEEGLSLAATLRDEGVTSADEVVFDAEARFHAVSLLDVLGSRERRVVERRFGLAGMERSTLEEISSELGCTRERVRQIQDEALRKMRREWQRRESRAAMERPAA